jgi:hypothetical protein
LLICLLACCQRVKNKIILPLDNAINRLTCEEWMQPSKRLSSAEEDSVYWVIAIPHAGK